MTWKQTQLNWYGGNTIQQDYDLQQFIFDNNITNIDYFGDCDQLQLHAVRKKKHCQISIYIVNRPEKISNIVNKCNQIINQLKPKDFVYLSINKFLIQHEPGLSFVEDYDESIFNYVSVTATLPVLKYYSGKNDSGKKFNWVHPLTRFYFLK
jgi:hypothetical protein